MMLGLLHVLAFLHWELTIPVVKILDPIVGVCWPFFENCLEWRILSPAGVQTVLWCYLGLAVLTMALFIRPGLIPVAWWALLGLNLFKSLILLQDYRLRLNQHYMTYWVTLAFLFLPGKRRVLQYLVVSFYFWAGTLKFTPEWISGAALYGKRPLGIPDSLIPVSSIYVMFLELIVVFGLLVRSRWIFWISMLQIAAFHVTSWPIVTFFYPTLMFAILTIFPLARYLRDPANPDETPPLSADLKSFFLGKERRAVYTAIAAFSLFQAVPYLFPGDSSVTGEGRLFALHMFDAPLECKASVIVYDTQGGSRRFGVSAPYLSPRIQCDPAVYFSLGKGLCKRLPKQAGFSSFDLHLATRRWGEKEFHSVIDQHDFCHAGLHYDLWRPNSWILKKR